MPASKRKAESVQPAIELPSSTIKKLKRETSSASATAPKAGKPDFSDRLRYKDSSTEVKYGIVQRQFYPPEMTNHIAERYKSGQIEKPITTLEKVLEETKSQRCATKPKDAVLHWYKCDLRTKDNHALSLAAKKAKEANVPLICMYLVSPQDFQAHLTAPVRVDFILRNLEVLKETLAKLDIPLYVETVEKRKNLPGRLLDLCDSWGVTNVYCNTEYEVDELRREAKLVRDCLDRGIAFNVVPDTCVVDPGKLMSGTGNQFAVYSPWHRKWCAWLNQHSNDLNEFEGPGANPDGTRKKLAKVFDCQIPGAPSNKSLSKEEKQKFKSLWPAGEEEALRRLQKFVKERISKYHETRNLPAGNGTATLSPHFAVGTLAARTAIRLARDAAPSKKLTDDRKQGHSMWIGEVAWRDFYKHVMCNWPYICMNKPFKPEYSNIEWEYDQDQFKRWSEGRTGFPIVDAAMRQARHMGYMHNRCRMIVASFLAKDLLIDWRMGEKWFMEHLIDGDFASNNGGWGFSASCGVDPQPYFRIFNPLLQSEKFDMSGDYIRKWVPELAEIKGKAIHDPYGRGAASTAKKNGYPTAMVDHKEARDKCLQRYKAALGRDTA